MLRYIGLRYNELGLPRLRIPNHPRLFRIPDTSRSHQPSALFSIASVLGSIFKPREAEQTDTFTSPQNMRYPDPSTGVKTSDITMVRPNMDGMLIAPVVGFEHKTGNPGVASTVGN
jgi:hypothetical protein